MHIQEHFIGKFLTMKNLFFILDAKFETIFQEYRKVIRHKSKSEKVTSSGNGSLFSNYLKKLRELFEFN